MHLLLRRIITLRAVIIGLLHGAVETGDKLGAQDGECADVVSAESPVPATLMLFGDAARAPMQPRAGAAGVAFAQGAVTLRALPLLWEFVHVRSHKEAVGTHPTPALSSSGSPQMKSSLGLSRGHFSREQEAVVRVTDGNAASLGQLQGIMSSDPVIHRPTSPWRAVVRAGRLGAQGWGDSCLLH